MNNINLYFIGLWNSFKYYMNCCGDSLYDPEYTHELNPYYYHGDITDYNDQDNKPNSPKKIIYKDDSDNDIAYESDSDISGSEILYDSDNDIQYNKSKYNEILNLYFDDDINSFDNDSIEQKNIKIENDNTDDDKELSIISDTPTVNPVDNVVVDDIVKEIISNTINKIIDQEYDEIRSDESFGSN